MIKLCLYKKEIHFTSSKWKNLKYESFNAENCSFSFNRAHFNYDNPDKTEMSFNKSDVFHVVDTLHNGHVGNWQAFRMGNSFFPLGIKAEKYYDNFVFCNCRPILVRAWQSS